MNKSCLIFASLLVALTTYCQTKKNPSPFNLDFERVEKGSPVGWHYFPNPSYVLSLDSSQVKTGKYAATIEYKEGKPDFRAWTFTIPHSYAGKRITLSGYIKTQNVTEGYAGLWLRMDPTVAFNNMNANGIKGTKDWAKYEITLNMDPKRTTRIVFGGLLVGKGKMWLDNLKVTIDGQDINYLLPLPRKDFLADTDTAFQQGSLITSIPINKTQVDNLKSLGLVWGFLKYYHPNIAKGEYNWDNALFRIFPQVIKAKNNKNRDEVFVNWIKSLGTFTEGKSAKVTASLVKINPDLDWITQSNFSAELTSLLLKVRDAQRSQEHYYMELVPNVGNPVFKNEKAYATRSYPDAGLRLLALYRYWNIIQYYFPYKNLLEEDWKKVLEEFIPKITATTNETDYTLTVLELMGRIHDSHASILGDNQVLNSYLGHNQAPIELTFVEGKPVITAYYNEKLGKETGLEVGDVISSINNKPVAALVQERLKYLPASNYPTKLRNLAPQLLRTNASLITVEFVRDHNTTTKTLKTYPWREFNLFRRYQATDTCFRLVHNNIAYLNNGSLKRDYLPIIWREIRATKGLIIDIRNYPSDMPIYDLSNYLMPQTTPFVKFTAGSLEHPGLFTFTNTLYAGGTNPYYYKGKVVLLMNKVSQSSAEFHAMAYRVHPNVTVLGSTTAGADGNVSRIDLPGGISTMISGIGVYYPNGKET